MSYSKKNVFILCILLTFSTNHTNGFIRPYFSNMPSFFQKNITFIIVITAIASIGMYTFLNIQPKKKNNKTEKQPTPNSNSNEQNISENTLLHPSTEHQNYDDNQGNSQQIISIKHQNLAIIPYFDILKHFETILSEKNKTEEISNPLFNSLNTSCDEEPCEYLYEIDQLEEDVKNLTQKIGKNITLKKLKIIKIEIEKLANQAKNSNHSKQEHNEIEKIKNRAMQQIEQHELQNLLYNLHNEKNAIQINEQYKSASFCEIKKKFFTEIQTQYITTNNTMKIESSQNHITITSQTQKENYSLLRSFFGGEEKNKSWTIERENNITGMVTLFNHKLLLTTEQNSEKNTIINIYNMNKIKNDEPSLQVQYTVQTPIIGAHCVHEDKSIALLTDDYEIKKVKISY